MTVRPGSRWLGSGRPLVGLLMVTLVAAGVLMITIGVRSSSAPPATAILNPDLSNGIVRERAVPRAGPAAPRSGPILPRSAPVRLDIPAIKVHSRVTSVGLQSDGTVEVPPLERDAPAGWYRYLATPGERGPAVILGHVDTAREGPAVFYRLGQLRRGDTVTVTRTDGSVAVFAVRSVIQVRKAQFPTDLVYGSTRSPELRLVTCGGRFDRDRRSYRDNIIAFAELRSVSLRSGSAASAG